MAAKKRARTVRRKLERELTSLHDAREKLALLSEGGAPERPIVVPSASVIETRALSLGCARCEGELRIESHDAVGGLRRVRARCRACGAVREIWFDLASRLLS
ncbi:hypothetical protein [Sandaracinus amylolyticus]|uniref:hypothetical protein n=1 Tax=Sandaracinus amylolyticus TaxID=927083 RepID=UPI001F23F09B|nr:hypothetical protein [Sandaracinus amylolyticus]UJR84502.1 Hypothetical protein I5071_65810 [Sandaracinus amylolyticus]